jgi:hypothetical protein
MQAGVDLIESAIQLLQAVEFECLAHHGDYMVGSGIRQGKTRGYPQFFPLRFCQDNLPLWGMELK